MTTYRTLVDCDTAREHLDDQLWQFVDCRFELANPAAGKRAWRESHLPGAVFADVERDLSAPVQIGTGRHPLPDRDGLVELVNALGISNHSQVVCYDASGGAFAARLWWLLKWLGHDAVAVLDGGWQGWIAGGLPVSEVPPELSSSGFVEHGAVVPVVDASMIEDDHPWQLVDARAGERFRGEVELIDRVAGHIPGAINRPFADNLDARGCFLPPEELRRRFDVAEPRSIVHYCGSGVTACHNVLAMAVAGLEGSALYPGSWSEWITRPERPVAVGND